MDVSAAHELLGTHPAMSATERRAAYQKQRHGLENHLVETAVPMLKERYRIAIARLDEAYAAVVIADASDQLPVLRAMPEPLPPGPAPGGQPPSTAAIWRELPYAADQGPGATGAAGPETPLVPAAGPGPALPIHPPTSSASIWRELAQSTAASETPAAPPGPPPAAPAPAPAPSAAPGADPAAPAAGPAFTPTPSTALPFLSPGRPGATTPGGSAATVTPSRGAQVLAPTHAHVRVQSRTPAHGAPVIPAGGERPADDATPLPSTRRPRERLLPWILVALLVGCGIAAVAVWLKAL
jgi:hypothetical protein